MGEGLYSNDGGSVALFRCKTNTLQLNWRQMFQGGVGSEETLRHFLKECRWLEA